MEEPMDPSLKRRLRRQLSERREELASSLQSLIRIPSFTGEEGELVGFILEAMRQAGFDEVYADGLGSAVGRIGEGPVTLLYDAHIDTVRVTDAGEWQHPPLEGRIAEGAVHGRGAVDEKAAMAGFLAAGAALRKLFSKGDLPFRLYVVGSVMEEDVDGYPLLHLIEKEGLKPDYVLLGEPTDLHVHRGQRGRMELEISTRGRAAHGAHNRLGINAIYKMVPIVRAIEKLDRALPKVPPLGRGSITVSDIGSRGPSLCSVPDFCRIHLDRRLTVGETRESVVAELNELVRRIGAEAAVEVSVYQGRSWKGTEVRQEAYFPTWILEEEHPLVQAGLEAAHLATGRKARSGFWSFSTNGVATAGHHRIPTIGFAPGEEALAHSSRERIAVEDLVRAAQFYALLPFVLTERLGR
jgi:putative selenium metabolism hydrolase